MNRLYRRKNALLENAGTDMEIQQMNELEEDDLSESGEKVQQIRALIDRIADLSHYRAFNDIDFIVEATGAKDYPGSPALDVLPSQDEIDRDRRERLKDYICCLTTWADGANLEDAVDDFKASEKMLRNTYIHLGAADEEKKWLIQCLIDALKGMASSPEDVIYEITDEEFVLYLYKTILGREPDEDDRKLRLAELKRGKPRQELVKEVLESRESTRRMLTEIAASVNLVKPPNSA